MDKDLTDRLHPWLLATLATSELDPNDVAEFVISLLGTPGTRDEVRQRCIAELGEFLDANTVPFVDALFAEIDRLQAQVQQSQLPGQAPQHQAPQAQQAQGQAAQYAQQQAPQGHDAQQQYPTGREQPLPPHMAGGQQEFRRNFRGDAPSFQYAPASGGPESAGPGGPQFFPPAPGFPPPGFMLPGFPPAGFGGAGALPPRQGRARNFHPQRQHQHNPMRSIRNELSVANKRLVVEGIPDEKLNEESVREYFGRFGTVTAVVLHAPQRMAEVEFEAHDQAVAAHKCPDPIFDNRFVKVFWRKRLPQEEEPEPDVEAVRRMQAIKQRQFEEKEVKRKELMAKLREVLGRQGAMLGEKQELLKSQAPPERIQEHQQQYDQLSEEAQRLKNELSLLSGGDAQPSGGRGGYRGGFRGGRGASSSPYGQSYRGSFRGRGGSFRGGYARGGGFSGASLDRRPKGVHLDGVSQDKDEILRGRLASSNYSDYQRNGDTSVVVDFADRKSAEDFFNTVNEIPELGPAVQKRYVHTEPSSANTSTAMDES